jgi:phosphate transport system permease protein
MSEYAEAASDWTGPLMASGNLRRRERVSRAIEIVAIGAAVIAVLMLALVVGGVVSHGASDLSFSFVTTNESAIAGGGIGNALIGTGVVVAFGALLAIPIGVLTALYLTEVAGPTSRSGRALKLALDLMQGLPTVIVGLFIYGLIVLSQGKQTGWAASLALAIVMLPLTARASQEVLLLVPGSLREAADALGVARWRAVVGVILPAAAGGIATGSILAVARAAGETAPVLICNSIYTANTTQLNIFAHGIPTVPMYIYLSADSIDPNAIKLAWAAAFVLLICILGANIAARMLLARSRRTMGI